MSTDDTSDEDSRRTPSSSTSMAEQLEGLDVDADTYEADDETGSSPVEGEGADSDEQAPAKGGAERFRDAVDELSREEMERRKFDGASPDDDQTSLGEAMKGELTEERPMPRPSSASDEAESKGEGRDPHDRLEAAVDDLSPEDMKRRKFDASDDDSDAPGRREESRHEESHREPSRSSSSTTSDEAARTELQRRHRREERQFEQAMDDVDPLDGESNRRSQDPPDPETFFERESSDDDSSTGPDFVTPILDKEGDGLKRVSPLDADQRAMRDRFETWAESWPVPELNLRGDTVEEALGRLAPFVDQCWREGERFARIIPGRGLRSDGLPALKPAVLTWLEEEGADYLEGYIPERSVEGDYGSLVVELETSHR